MAKYKKEEIEEAKQKLTEFCPPGTTIHTLVTHVSRSGMSRSIRCLLCDGDGPWDISYLVARLLGESMDHKNGGLKVTGCGMDMGFHIVHALSYKLHGFETKGKRAKEAYEAGRYFKPSRRQYRAGYSLEHRWL